MIFFLLAIIIALAQIVQTISGFGSSLITVTLAIHFINLPLLLTIIVPLNFLQSSYICIRYREHINYGILLKKVIPFMIIGIVLGLSFKEILLGSLLKQVFGIFIMITSSIEMYKMYHKQHNSRALSKWKSSALLISSGFIHGIYSCGGPPLVYYLGTLNISKQQFRSTLVSIWAISNIFLMTSYLRQGLFHKENLLWVLYLIPVVIASVWMGDKIHHWVCEQKFRVILFCFLFLAGISLLF